MKSLDRSVIFAALVVGSSLAMLPGAQADNIQFGPGNNDFTVTNEGGGELQMVSGIISSPATFPGLSGTDVFATPGGTGAILLSGFNGTNSFGTITTSQDNPTKIPNFVTFANAFGAGVSGTLTVTRVQDNPDGTVSLIGDELVTTSNPGNTPSLGASFPLGFVSPFDWTLHDGGTTLAQLLNEQVGTSITLVPGLGTQVGVPGPIVGAGLPGLIAALGGLVAMARRRRKQLA